MNAKLDTITLCPYQSRQRVQEIYQQLASNAPNISFFNSWPWLSTWLKCLPENQKIKFVVNLADEQPTACFFLGLTNKKENRFKKQRGFLNSTGDEVFDDLVIEYNSIISPFGSPTEQLRIAFSNLTKVEELRVPHSFGLDVSLFSDYFVREQETPAYWVDLTQFSDIASYKTTRSKNTRHQLRQSFNAYHNQYGPIQIVAANSTQQALEFLDALKPLHQVYWQGRGKTGSFSSTFFEVFHKTLIEDYFDAGVVQLLKVTSGKEVLGYLYNFVHNNEVLFYQSGFNYLPENKFRPGLVSHTLAIEYNLNANKTKYNFLASHASYKARLSTHHDMLNSWVISKRTMTGYLEKCLRLIADKR